MPARHVTLAVAVAVVWGVNFVVIHVGLESMPPLLFAALRFTLVALPAVFLVGRPGVPARYVIGAGLFTSAAQFGLLFTGMANGMPAGLASLVLQLQAVFTIGLAVALLGERPRPAQVAGAAIALAGIAVIAAGRATAVPFLALALSIGAAASWGVGNVITRVARPPDAIAMLVWSSLVPPIPLAALSFALERPYALEIDAGGVLAVAYVVGASTFFGFGAWNWLLRRHEASKVAPFTLLVPVVGIVAAWVALAERPSVTEIAGGLIALTGLALATGALRARGRLPASPGDRVIQSPV
jgi:O-acetylserine/cysteine efflux transporter